VYNIKDIINTIICGDALKTVQNIPDKSISCVITSPPYYLLRNYGWAGQWGIEPTFREYLEKLWCLMDEIYRVLRNDGTVFVNLGDTYSSGTIKGYPAQSQFVIPHRFYIGCLDGVNGHKQWIGHNDIIWAKNNMSPESVKRRFSKKHEFVFYLVKNEDHYFDLDTIKIISKTFEVDKRVSALQRARMFGYNTKQNKAQEALHGHKPGECKEMPCKSANQFHTEPPMRNPGDVSDFWNIPTVPNNEKHFAVFNYDLIDKPIIGGCPEFICKKCGKAREKILVLKNGIMDRENQARRIVNIPGREKANRYNTKDKSSLEYTYEGMSDCGCGAGFKPGIILDPFCGVGTTLLRAKQLKRAYIGVDGSSEFVKRANEIINGYGELLL
jgi:DNA modification methylase